MKRKLLFHLYFFLLFLSQSLIPVAYILTCLFAFKFLFLMVGFKTCSAPIFMHVWMPVCGCMTAPRQAHARLCVCCCCCCGDVLWSELCDILPCCWIRWHAECISSARWCHSVFCRLSATSALSRSLRRLITRLDKRVWVVVCVAIFFSTWASSFFLFFVFSFSTGERKRSVELALNKFEC